MRMTHVRVLTVVVIAVAFAVAGFGPGDGRKGPDPHIAEYAALIKAHTDALVVVKYVQKIAVAGQEIEDDDEAVGVMIDPAGLVVCSSSSLGSFEMEGVTMTATNIKVLIGDDNEGLEASLIVRDKELDLAWVRIRKPGGKTFKAIDPAKHAMVQPGQRLLTLSRLGKYFDRAPEVLEGRISAIATKPRDLIAPGGLAGAMGDPVFTPEGIFVGVFVTQGPEKGDSGEDDSALDGAVMILPATTLDKATARARTMSPEQGAALKPAASPATDDDTEGDDE